MTLPALFVSHGAPTLIVERTPARDFLAGLGATLDRPEAVVCLSAHWETARPTVAATPAPPTIHDFYGFPPALYEIAYPAPGAPDVARRVAAALESAGMAAEIDTGRGLDHGAWVPLKLMFPAADVPVLQLSIQPHLGPEHHLRIGRALAPLRADGILVLASGGATHNLMEFRGQPADAPVRPHVAAFDAWLVEAVESGDVDRLLDYRRQAPEAPRIHPRDEHFLPLFAALGAGGEAAPGRRIHASFEYGILSMAAFAFG